MPVGRSVPGGRVANRYGSGSRTGERLASSVRRSVSPLIGRWRSVGNERASRRARRRAPRRGSASARPRGSGRPDAPRPRSTRCGRRSARGGSWSAGKPAFRGCAGRPRGGARLVQPLAVSISALSDRSQEGPLGQPESSFRSVRASRRRLVRTTEVLFALCPIGPKQDRSANRSLLLALSERAEGGSFGQPPRLVQRRGG